jgi:hypothetical protein
MKKEKKKKRKATKTDAVTGPGDEEFPEPCLLNHRA